MCRQLLLLQDHRISCVSNFTYLCALFYRGALRNRYLTQMAIYRVVAVTMVEANEPQVLEPVALLLGDREDHGA